MNMVFQLSALALSAFASVSAWALADDNCEAGNGNSPLVVDVKGDGIRFGPAGVGVSFDLLASGTPQRTQWVRAGGNDGFLVIDLNGNGKIDDGSELFGEGTTLVVTGEKARNGFVALAQYDQPALGGNDDGEITSADSIWPMLRVWTDSNADGKTQRSELATLNVLGLVALGTIPKYRRYVDESGNDIPFYAWVTNRIGRKVLMVDVFFRELP